MLYSLCGDDEEIYGQILINPFFSKRPRVPSSFLKGLGFSQRRPKNNEKYTAEGACNEKSTSQRTNKNITRSKKGQ
jgi:hypothetical protein